jgi:16S rRNA (guanine(1405)-N(7))-methyltransferase
LTDSSALPLLEKLISAVQANPKYRAITPALVRRICAIELAKGRDYREAIKAVRNKLHQIGGAFLESGADFPRWSAILSTLPPGDTPALRDFCRTIMAHHASTRERLPILEHIFTETLAPLAPVASVLDLACGLNPLAIPWMPLADQAPYLACDIYEDLTVFLSRFLAHLGRPGGAEVCDLVESTPAYPVQLALLLKAIPCLEQIDKEIARRLLESIPARHILVSFPAHSLGGRSKGMPENYTSHFSELVTGRPWTIHRYQFPGELVFRIDK